jgi:hypothetical protein
VLKTAVLSRVRVGGGCTTVKKNGEKNIYFFFIEQSYFSCWGKSHDKPDVDVPRWMGAQLTYLELPAGNNKQVIAF